MRYPFRDTIVYWKQTGANALGRPAYAPPLQYINGANWQDEVMETIDRDGNTVYSSSTVFLAIDVMPGDLLFRGTLAEVQAPGFPANPRDNEMVREVINKQRTKDLRGVASITEAKLK